MDFITIQAVAVFALCIFFIVWGAFVIRRRSAASADALMLIFVSIGVATFMADVIATGVTEGWN